jgi:hypothetical protein
MAGIRLRASTNRACVAAAASHHPTVWLRNLSSAPPIFLHQLGWPSHATPLPNGNVDSACGNGARLSPAGSARQFHTGTTSYRGGRAAVERKFHGCDEAELFVVSLRVTPHWMGTFSQAAAPPISQLHLLCLRLQQIAEFLWRLWRLWLAVANAAGCRWHSSRTISTVAERDCSFARCFYGRVGGVGQRVNCTPGPQSLQSGRPECSSRALQYFGCEQRRNRVQRVRRTRTLSFSFVDSFRAFLSIWPQLPNIQCERRDPTSTPAVVATNWARLKFR